MKFIARLFAAFSLTTAIFAIEPKQTLDCFNAVSAAMKSEITAQADGAVMIFDRETKAILLFSADRVSAFTLKPGMSGPRILELRPTKGNSVFVRFSRNTLPTFEVLDASEGPAAVLEGDTRMSAREISLLREILIKQIKNESATADSKIKAQENQLDIVKRYDFHPDVITSNTELLARLRRNADVLRNALRDSCSRVDNDEFQDKVRISALWLDRALATPQSRPSSIATAPMRSSH